MATQATERVSLPRRHKYWVGISEIAPLENNLAAIQLDAVSMLHVHNLESTKPFAP